MVEQQVGLGNRVGRRGACEFALRVASGARGHNARSWVQKANRRGFADRDVARLPRGHRLQVREARTRAGAIACGATAGVTGTRRRYPRGSSAQARGDGGGDKKCHKEATTSDHCYHSRV